MSEYQSQQINAMEQKLSEIQAEHERLKIEYDKAWKDGDEQANRVNVLEEYLKSARTRLAFLNTEESKHYSKDNSSWIKDIDALLSPAPSEKCGHDKGSSETRDDRWELEFGWNVLKSSCPKCPYCKPENTEVKK